MPEILQIVNSGKPGNVSLIGDNYTLTLDFTLLGKNVLKEVNDLIVKYMGEA